MCEDYLITVFLLNTKIEIVVTGCKAFLIPVIISLTVVMLQVVIELFRLMNFKFFVTAKVLGEALFEASFRLLLVILL